MNSSRFVRWKCLQCKERRIDIKSKSFRLLFGWGKRKEESAKVFCHTDTHAHTPPAKKKGKEITKQIFGLISRTEKKHHFAYPKVIDEKNSCAFVLRPCTHWHTHRGRKLTKKKCSPEKKKNKCFTSYRYLPFVLTSFTTLAPAYTQKLCSYFFAFGAVYKAWESEWGKAVTQQPCVVCIAKRHNPAPDNILQMCVRTSFSFYFYSYCCSCCCWNYFSSSVWKKCCVLNCKRILTQANPKKKRKIKL